MPRLTHRLLLAFVFTVGILAAGYLSYGDGGGGGPEFWDPKSSMNRSGSKTDREFYIPPVPPYEKVDFQEYLDYRKTHYSPYAQLQVYQTLQVGNIQLQSGYHLVKLEIIAPQSIVNTVQPTSAEAPSVLEKVQKWPIIRAFTNNDKPPLYHKRPLPNVDPTSQGAQGPSSLNMVIKQMGAKELVVPVYSSEPSQTNLKKESKALLVSDVGDPVNPNVVYLKYCIRKICYRSAPLLPGLVQ